MGTKEGVGRRCKDCGAPSDQHARCSVCSPRRRITPHWDKYAEKATASWATTA